MAYLKLSLLLLSTSGLLNSVLAVPQPPKRSLLDSALGGLGGLLGVDQTFDYVVVGGGTAGAAIAYRLAENPANHVALIEAGSHYEIGNPVFSSTPAGDIAFIGASPLDTNPLVDWGVVTVPQEGAANRKFHYCRGRTLGGSSARNFMIYQRGTKQSLDSWAEEVGDSSYSWNKVLPYYKKPSTFTPPDTAKRFPNTTTHYDTSAFSADGGPLQVSYANYAQSFSTYMDDAFDEMGVGIAEDFNSGTLQGGQFCSSTIVPGNQNRGSSEVTFLQAAATAGFTNLKIFEGTLAKKILFDGKTATGVRCAAVGLRPFTLKARKEVIVSAGAFNSPQLLMVSGIGPRATLEKYGIPVLVDNPNVGQNMWDHVFAGPSYRVNVETLTKLLNDSLYLADQLADEYILKQSGPLTNPVADYLAWEKVPETYRQNLSSSTREDLAKFPADWPELEFISGAGYVGDFQNPLLGQPKDGHMYATLLAALVAPTSRGSVTISSSDTSVLPVVDPNFLATKADQEVAIAAYKRAREFFQTKSLRRIVIGDEYFPGANVTGDAEILEVWRNTVMTVWHASCTCKMGKADDPTAVLDSKARVLGVKKLRVVDASSFPLLPPGHPQSTVYMLAEKIADDINKGNQ